MNVAIAQQSPPRLAELDPFNVGGTVEAPLVHQLGKAAYGSPRGGRMYADAEYGCVDWYQYRDPANAEKTTH